MFVGLVLLEYFSSANSSRFLRASSSLDQMLTACYDSFELLHLIQTLCRALECWTRRWLKKAVIFPVTWFLKPAGYFMPLWEEGIAVFVSGPVTGVIGKSKSRLARFLTHSGAQHSPQPCFIIRFQSREYFPCKLANSLLLKKNLACPIPVCI